MSKPQNIMSCALVPAWCLGEFSQRCVAIGMFFLAGLGAFDCAAIISY